MYLAQFMRYSSTLLKQCILGVTLMFDLSRSLFFNNINVWSYGSGKNLLPISSLFAEIKYVNEKRPMLYNGIFGYHRNMCYVIFINAFFARYMV